MNFTSTRRAFGLRFGTMLSALGLTAVAGSAAAQTAPDNSGIRKLNGEGKPGSGAFHLPATPNGRGVATAWAAAADEDDTSPEPIGLLIVSGDEAAANPAVSYPCEARYPARVGTPSRTGVFQPTPNS